MDFEHNLTTAPRSKRKWTIGALVVGLLIFAILTWIGSNFLFAVNKITEENETGKSPFLNFDGNLTPTQLQGEGDGRINILLLGMGGKGHPGGSLTDTIIVFSIDPQNKTAALLSIPRDLYVPIEGRGSAKVNEAYASGEMYKQGGGGTAAKKTIANILDLPIHYYVVLDFDAFKKIVDALGGVNVYVDKAINDPYYPDAQMKGYNPFQLSAGLHKMDGNLALKYARSRETTSDFDRSKRQQKLISIIAAKATSVGILANPKKVTDILKILGEHVKTDLSLSEIERLVTIVKNVPADQIVTKVLDNGADGPLVSVNDGGYYLKPKTGNFKEIQRIAHEIFSEPYIVSEAAKIEVLNASSKTGAALQVADMLKSYGYKIVNVANSTEKSKKTQILDYTAGNKPFTIKFLTDRFKVQAAQKTASANSKADISIIIGDDYKD